MLIQFNFKNFKSFRDDTTLDLSATKITEHSDRVISIGNEKVLPVGAIYGANASGKTKLLEAFMYMCNYVIESFAFGGDVDERKNQKGFVRPTPFLFDKKSKEAESTFEVYFIGDEKENYKSYNYGFSIDAYGVKEEWLNTRAKYSRGGYKNIFYRNRDEKVLELDGLTKQAQENIKTALENETLIVSLGAKLKVEKLKCVRNWFLNILYTDFGNPVFDLISSRVLPKNFGEDEKIRQDVVRYLSSFDESIVDFKVEKETKDVDQKVFKVRALHKEVNTDEVIPLSLGQESAGTLKMFALYPNLQRVIENGGVLVIDELNARLHPLLVRNFLISFLDPKINKHHAQIIFTTHDAWMLANNLLRRDEIWFTEKDSDGVSSLYSLVDIEEDGSKIRKDENYEKNYLLGKYGGIPVLKTLMGMEDNE